MTVDQTPFSPPKVLIVGAGIAGLFLSILLDKAGIPYDIYERAASVKPIGSLMSLNANILPALEQTGLYEDFMKIALPGKSGNVMNGNMEIIAKFRTDAVREEMGYEFMLFARPKLYDLLLSRVPVERIHYGVKVISTEQDSEGVTIHCADGSSHKGHILVGADGAYSKVRESLYKSMREQNILPAQDAQQISRGYVSLLGMTEPLDPKVHPYAENDESVQYSIIGQGTQYTWSVFNLRDNRIAWIVVAQLSSQEQSDKEKFRNVEWGPKVNGAMIEDVKDFKVPYGNMTLGDLINLTPQDTISRTYFDDKLFQTWNHGRTVLIGDAAHKLLPSAGQGAVNALQDAIILSSCLYELTSLSPAAIDFALSDFKAQRFSHVKEQYDLSHFNAKIIYGQTFVERCLRWSVFNLIPDSIKQRSSLRGSNYRPQATFLPKAPKRGTIEVLPQKESERYKRECAAAAASAV
ncbi:hypothetical protein EMPS_06998 [Entomortierella parvispora]|uniref:FAD-binding domain-containing protein n=1 Tax=Entomortierella parvispora TaxID=205924 RepID=A0A9P3HDB3_9FUNG|nr:hypothetical protein EMPS_06998 [Entomortierella parvispora]